MRVLKVAGNQQKQGWTMTRGKQRVQLSPGGGAPLAYKRKQYFSGKKAQRFCAF